MNLKSLLLRRGVKMETFTVRELAIYLRCSQSVIRKLVTKKEIPFYNIGKRILFRKIS